MKLSLGERNAALLDRWQSKDLKVLDLDTALRTLTFIGYFRLRGYALPLMRLEPDGSRVFNCGTSFLDILARYELDRDLRRVTLGQSQDP